MTIPADIPVVPLPKPGSRSAALALNSASCLEDELQSLDSRLLPIKRAYRLRHSDGTALFVMIVGGLVTIATGSSRRLLRTLHRVFGRSGELVVNWFFV
jgi:hypothetical protein